MDSWYCHKKNRPTGLPPVGSKCVIKDDGYEYSLSCGSGFSDIQREEYWSKRNHLIGQLVEIRADAKTKSKDAVAFSLRFPRFKCFRGFKAGEKV